MSCASDTGASEKTSWKSGRCLPLPLHISGYQRGWRGLLVRRSELCRTSHLQAVAKGRLADPHSLPTAPQGSKWKGVIGESLRNQGVRHHRRSCADVRAVVPSPCPVCVTEPECVLLPQGIEAMHRDSKLGYWLSMAMHRKNPRRVLTALRYLLTAPKPRVTIHYMIC